MLRGIELDRLLANAVAAAASGAAAALEPLIAYDRNHAGDLVRTLRVYLALGCNASRTAEALYLHRSGLLYRLGRIEDLLGVDLSSFRERVALEIAVLGIEDGSRATDYKRSSDTERNCPKGQS
jgi:DNA-binding PucR family transcriptional regulator